MFWWQYGSLFYFIGTAFTTVSLFFIISVEAVCSSKESSKDSKEGSKDRKEGSKDSKSGSKDSKESSKDSKESSKDSKESSKDSKSDSKDSKESSKDSKSDSKDSKESSKDSNLDLIIATIVNDIKEIKTSIKFLHDNQNKLMINDLNLEKTVNNVQDIVQHLGVVLEEFTD